MNPLKTASYDYELPPELIASHPASPRDSAKLLIYNRSDKSIRHSYFYNLLDFIPDDTTIIFNDTKVIKARIFGVKESGAKIELLINKPLNLYDINVYIRGRVKPSNRLLFENNLTATIKELNSDGTRIVNFFHNDNLIKYDELILILDSIGHIPLPPYINRADEDSDEIEYQSVFAINSGAVAAPTASLHFSDELFAKTIERFKHGYLTLHVGSGTFKPVEAENILDHPIHSEYYTIEPKTIEILESKSKILAIGTTATRTIEHFVRSNCPSGEANVYLHPHNKPMRVDYLLTNFHLPQSTLLMLVSSFVGIDEMHRIYSEAIKNSYRFYSYGDAMLIL